MFELVRTERRMFAKYVNPTRSFLPIVCGLADSNLLMRPIFTLLRYDQQPHYSIRHVQLCQMNELLNLWWVLQYLITKIKEQIQIQEVRK